LGRYGTSILVSPSANLGNGNIADVRLKRKCSFVKLRILRDLQKNRVRVVQIEVVGYRVRSINCGKRHHYCREFRSINDFILQNWGACVDTVLGHVSMFGRVQDGRIGRRCFVYMMNCR